MSPQPQFGGVEGVTIGLASSTASISPSVSVSVQRHLPDAPIDASDCFAHPCQCAQLNNKANRASLPRHTPATQDQLPYSLPYWEGETRTPGTCVDPNRRLTGHRNGAMLVTAKDVSRSSAKRDSRDRPEQSTSVSSYLGLTGSRQSGPVPRCPTSYYLLSH
jgi:hypothetical protein